MDLTADAHIAATAARQHGVFTSRQAQAAGLSQSQIRNRVSARRWELLARSVYRIGGVPETWTQTAMAASLTRPDGVLSHLTAAALHGLDAPIPPRPQLIVPPRTSARSAIARARRLQVSPQHVVRRRGMPVTDGARTLIDCADLLGPVRLGRLADDALHRRVATVQAVLSLIDENAISQRAPALTALAAHLEVWDHAIRPGSAGEARLLRQLAEWGLPPPDRQIEIVDAHGVVIGRLDTGWRAAMLGLEYDSIEWHGPAAWADDERRHALVEATGWRLLHVDSADLRPGRPWLRDRLRRELSPATTRR